jgi:sugar/nucleoside kinase (ribokinase family)
VLGAVGDLIEDIVVQLTKPLPAAGSVPGVGGLMVRVGSDSWAVIERRQGGSAANVCAAVAALGRPARFIGQVGEDDVGRRLVATLIASGVEPMVRWAGRTGTVIVLTHSDGERSLITDPGDAGQLSPPDLAWLDGLTALHVPLYAVRGGPLADTTLALVAAAHLRGLRVSVDLSSTALLDELGPARVSALVDVLEPAVVLANEAEAEAVSPDLDLAQAVPLAVVKRGPQPALVLRPGSRPDLVPAAELGPVDDTTGAGDAFAAGLLVALGEGADALGAVAAGHRSAAARLVGQQRSR